ncbi:epidermal growth factor receptor kinase substrate 8-like protein 3b [Scomber japonicus]|uniref:epidermal growth factor receptor kinase substrate 8-like protein 3b n=1 Tax=Scomber japonicus TaxID=13676 RepID=UPI002305C3C9|nr:epidermal growth factor receptor kinase substrate 8-like protein 3b [Scomber japonicus]
MYRNHAPFSYSPGGFSQEDLPQQRWGLQQDDQRGGPPERNNMSRPSGKSIYQQRKEYSDVLNRGPDNLHVRVEHLFTCELDGRETRSVDDCVAKLKRLDVKGRLWPQQMVMEVQGGYLLLSDIETKAELEALPVSSIQSTKAVLDTCAYNSVLTVIVQERSKRITQVYLFQCEETGADLIKRDLDKIVQNGGSHVEPRREQPNFRGNLQNMSGQHAAGSSFRQAGPRPMQQERTLPPPDHLPPQWGNSREPEMMPRPQIYSPHEELMHHPDLHELQSNPDMSLSPEQRDIDILNHVLDDLEIFTGKVSAALNGPPGQDKKNKKKGLMKMKKKKKEKSNENAISLPYWEEYVSCLQKIKYGFNLLGQLDRALNNPSAPDLVHIFFSRLSMILPQYPADLPPTVLSPLLTDAALRLIGEVVTPEEDQIWRSLGDCWNVPRSGWPDDDIPPYYPEFYNGWQPPAPIRRPSQPSFQNSPMSRSNSQRFPPGHPNGQINDSQGFAPRGMEEPMSNSPWSSRPPSRSGEPPLHMRVAYDFRARNNQECNVVRGEVVEVLQKTRQWWLVRNTRNEEGNVPQHVLESLSSAGPVEDLRDTRGGPVTLDMRSTPPEVKAWLDYKGFSKITASSLGVLNGHQLLGMTKEEIRTVCPEEGGKVFFQLQGVKSAIALASEPSGPYNGRY